MHYIGALLTLNRVYPVAADDAMRIVEALNGEQEVSDE